MFTVEDFQFFLEYVYGFVTIDMEGKVTYINQQVCDFCNIDRNTAIGKHVNEVFPFSKMMDTIKYKQPTTTEFYFYDGRASASTRHPMIKDGKMVGVLEYDIFQDMTLIEAFIEHYINLDEELKYFKEEAQHFRMAKYTLDNLIGHSMAITHLKEQIRYVARSNSTVLIQGETGTGKELIAHSIHNLSKRSLQNFIKVNSANFPESLAESELFGYEPGSFTGANREGRKGKFELADHGTLFIDEINQMPLILQPKFLRVLQEKEIDRIGSSNSIPLDIRIIAASNKDLKQLVSDGLFREDLYYRLNVIEIKVPPLRERKEDIRVLTEHYVSQYNNLLGKNVKNVEESAYKLLMDYEWPGNIRELQNIIEKSMNYIEKSNLTADDLDFNILAKKTSFDLLKDYDRPIEQVLRQTERSLILQTLEKYGGNKTKTAQFLKIPRTLLYKKMNRLNINK